MNAYATTTHALLYGCAPTPLTLHYTCKDPAAVRIELATIRRSWHVARDRLARGLEPGNNGDEYTECASRVHCSLLPGTRALLVLRDQPLGARYPLAVSTADLLEFLATTYLMCPEGLERDVIAAELDAQLGMFATTQEGQQP